MKLKIVLVTAVITIILGAKAFASEIPPDVRVNGEYIESVSFMKDDKTYVPLRSVAEKLGYTVVWKENMVVVGGTLEINDFIIKDGKAYLPLREIAEKLRADVAWDGELFIADLKTYDSKGDDSLYWLSRIIHAESSGEPLEGKVAVGNVVVNRVLSNDFPNTVREVVFDRKGGVQFTPVSNGTIYNKPSKEAVLAAKLVMRGENAAGKSLFFMNPRIAVSSWISRNRKFYKTIKNHDFYL